MSCRFGMGGCQKTKLSTDVEMNPALSFQSLTLVTWAKIMADVKAGKPKSDKKEKVKSVAPAVQSFGKKKVCQSLDAVATLVELQTQHDTFA